MFLNLARLTRLAAVFTSLSLGAQADAIQELIAAKLAASFSANAQATPGGQFLLLTQLGIPVTPSGIADSYDMSLLLDQVPRLTWQYEPSGLTYSSLYQSIIRLSEVTRYQDQRRLNRVHDARRFLRDRLRPGRPSPAYATYIKYKNRHARALDAQATARTEQRASGQQPPPDLERRIKQALTNWIQLGQKLQVEEALAIIHQAYDSNVRVLFYGLDQELQLAGQRYGRAHRWYEVHAEPPIQTWLDADGWQPWTFRAADVPTEPTPVTLPKANPPPRIGQELNATWQGSLTMTAQLKRVSITRPWLDQAIFNSRAWRLPASGTFKTVSTGNPTDSVPGVMPLLVTGVLLAKELTLTGAWDRPDARVEAPAALGPFALANPNPTGPQALQTSIYTYDQSLSIRVKGAQIIGFFCELLPQAPNPDPKFFR